jgi:hypothetical protein
VFNIDARNYTLVGPYASVIEADFGGTFTVPIL